MAGTQGTVRRALDCSIDAAVKGGRLDREANAALIAAARKVAGVMDEPDWPIVCRDSNGNGKFDNVSPSALLKYCEALGVCPDIGKAGKAEAKSGLARLRGDINVMKGCA